MTILTKEIREFGYNEFNAYAGVEAFADGSTPLIFEGEGGESTFAVLAGNTGVEVILYNEGEEDSVSLFRGARAFDYAEDRKKAILAEFNRVIDVIKGSSNLYLDLLKSLDDYVISIG